PSGSRASSYSSDSAFVRSSSVVGNPVRLENDSPKRIRPVKANCPRGGHPSSTQIATMHGGVPQTFRRGPPFSNTAAVTISGMSTCLPAGRQTEPDAGRQRQSPPEDRSPRREPGRVVDLHPASPRSFRERGGGVAAPRVSRERLRSPRRLGAAPDPGPPLQPGRGVAGARAAHHRRAAAVGAGRGSPAEIAPREHSPRRPRPLDQSQADPSLIREGRGADPRGIRLGAGAG